MTTTLSVLLVMTMPSHRSVVILLVVACSAEQSRFATSTLAVPLTASASASIVTSAVYDDIVPPWTLTASDGSGLVLTRVDAKAVVEGPLAFTELHLYFHNPEARVREGTFQITLPQRAAVSRFAMEHDGRWMEAEVVEKQLARRAYDDFLHRRQDPALLEKAAGNQFTAKVFPIAANTDKHLVISYSQELPGASYTLPLRGLPKTERVDVTLAFTGADGTRSEQTLAKRNWEADVDFVSTASVGAAGVFAGNLVAAQIEVGQRADLNDQPASITLLVDTSASRALGYARYIDSVHALVGSLGASWGAQLPLQVVAFDQDAEMIFDGRAGDFAAAHRKKLIERGAAGASDLGQAVAWIARHSPHRRVVVISDGVVTAGVEGGELQAKIKALGAAKVERIDFALAGGLRDEAAMLQLVRSGLLHAGAVFDLDRDAVATALAETVALDVAIEVPGAVWRYPATLSTARAGTRTMVYARMPRAMSSIEVKTGGKSQQVALVAGTAPLVERALASAELDELEAKLANTGEGVAAAKLRTQIVRKSVAARVVSSQTAMLVLETEDDYARYHIDRKALADVLVVGAKGIERKRRAGAQLVVPARTAHAAVKARTSSNEDEDLVRLFGPESVEVDAVSDSRSSGRAAVEASAYASARGMAIDHDAESAVVEYPMVYRAESRAERDAATRRLNELRNEVAVRHRRVAAEAARVERRQAVRISREMMENPLAVERHAASAPTHSDGIDARQRARYADADTWPPAGRGGALTGELAEIMKLLEHDVDTALTRARDWHAREPGNVLALIGLGEALEAKGSKVTAARVYGSIIDLYPGRVDMRRFAGERLARLQSHAQDLVIDTYRRAVADRPDHLTGHRLLAYALVRAGKHAEGFAAILAGRDRLYPDARFAGGNRVLDEDAAMIGAAFAAAVPSQRATIDEELAKRKLALATKPSTRFILYWETDANDVDFHIVDAKHDHAFYSQPSLATGGELYADVTSGYGPECFAIEGTPKAAPYRVSVHYYAQGPMGFGMGLLQIQRFDGKGRLTFEDRPYVIMSADAIVDLGTVK